MSKSSRLKGPKSYRILTLLPFFGKYLESRYWFRRLDFLSSRLIRNARKICVVHTVQCTKSWIELTSDFLLLDTLYSVFPDALLLPYSHRRKEGKIPKLPKWYIVLTSRKIDLRHKSRHFLLRCQYNLEVKSKWLQKDCELSFRSTFNKSLTPPFFINFEWRRYYTAAHPR